MLLKVYTVCLPKEMYVLGMKPRAMAENNGMYIPHKNSHKVSIAGIVPTADQWLKEHHFHSLLHYSFMHLHGHIIISTYVSSTYYLSRMKRIFPWGPVFLITKYKAFSGGWKYDSAVESAHCSLKEPEIDSWHPHWVPQNCLQRQVQGI